MTMADILAAISITILIGMGFPALLLILNLTLPNLVEATSSQVATHPIRLMLRGLATFLLISLLALIFLNAPGPAKLLGIGLLLAMGSLTMIGAAGLIDQLSQRYGQFAGTSHTVKNLFASAIFLELAAALPFIGWFVILPFSLCLMLGAGSKVLLQRKRTKTTINLTPSNKLNEPVVSSF